ncbi:MAG: DciA family protein [Alphaproteobacteria bacterium]|nr:DciA family protein [Alphaproteobacteria bacterium]
MEQTRAKYSALSEEASRERKPWLKPVAEQRFAAQLPKILRPSLSRRRLVSAQMIIDWPLIVGKNLARDSLPQRMVRDRAAGTARLIIEVRSGLALEMQHLEPLVIERINQYFGFGFVTGISLVQTHSSSVARNPGRVDSNLQKRPTVGAEALSPRVNGKLDEIKDAGLKQQLLRLGLLVFGTGRGR